MKVLWVCNVPIPQIANYMGIKAPNICGWLTGFANSLQNSEKIDLYITFPQMGIKKITEGQVGNIKYYAFTQPKILGFLPAENPLHASSKMKKHIEIILAKVQPDILHIWGTEYQHSLIATQLFGSPTKTIINIQGLTSYYWMHFNTGIPYKELKRITISNIVRGNLLKQEKIMRQRGISETQTIKNAKHIVGRTDWDEACVKEINPNVTYHFCNESLRDSFYTDTWKFEKCEKYSIFMSQASTPIKGLHFMLRAMPEILKHYPDTHLYIAGNDLIKEDGIYDKLKMSSFAKYIKKLIYNYHLEHKITFTGSLDERQMKQRFLKSNVYVCASTIENSPNSLGEAMLLGMPCISSDVGGVKNLLEHGTEGFIYQENAPYMLAYYIKKIFADSNLAKSIGQAAQIHARQTHDRKKNSETLMNIYEQIL